MKKRHFYGLEPRMERVRLIFTCPIHKNPEIHSRRNLQRQTRFRFNNFLQLLETLEISFL